MDIKPILGTAVGLGATSLMLHSTKMIPKFKMKKGKFSIKSNKSIKPIVRGSVDLMVGTALLRGAASEVNKL